MHFVAAASGAKPISSIWTYVDDVNVNKANGVSSVDESLTLSAGTHVVRHFQDLHALRHHRQRMTEDHANARRLAEGLVRLPGIQLDAPVQTNIVRFRWEGRDARVVSAALVERGVGVMAVGPSSFRAVTHLMISPSDIDATLAVFSELAAGTTADAP